MDDDNIDDLKSMAPTQCKAKVELLGMYDPKGERIIRDPYYVSLLVSPNLITRWFHLLFLLTFFDIIIFL